MKRRGWRRWSIDRPLQAWSRCGSAWISRLTINCRPLISRCSNSCVSMPCRCDNSCFSRRSTCPRARAACNSAASAGILFLNAPIPRQCAAKRKRKIGFSGSIAHDFPSVPVCCREAGNRAIPERCARWEGARGVSQRAPHPDWNEFARDPDTERIGPAAQDFEFSPVGSLPGWRYVLTALKTRLFQSAHKWKCRSGSRHAR